MRIDELKELCQEYPVCIPVRVAAKFLGMAEDCLRASIEQGRCPFGLGWQLGTQRMGFKIPTMAFVAWLTKGCMPLEI